MAQKLNVQYIRFYTDGSAAHKVAPVAPIETMKLPKVKKQKKIVLRVDPVSVAAIVMAAVMLVLMVVGVTQLRGARQDAEVMEAYANTLRQENVRLSAEYSNGYDLEQIEKTALALGLVPQEQVRHISLQVPQIQEEETPGAWERFYIFLTGLFA